MARSKPTRPDRPRDEGGVRDRGDLPESDGPALGDPPPQSARHSSRPNRRDELLDTEPDVAWGDPGFGRSFADDVRSDGYDDERRERR